MCYFKSISRCCFRCNTRINVLFIFISVSTYYCWICLFNTLCFFNWGLHLDGLGDTFDGVFSYREKEKIIEIMKDSRLGTNGLLAILFVLILDGLFIGFLPPAIGALGIFLMPVACRVSCLVTGATNNYINRSYGMSKDFVSYANLKNCFPMLLISAIIFVLCFSYGGLGLYVIIFIFPFLASRFFSKKIGGFSGDIIGAVVELTQLVYLVSLFLFYRGGLL